LIKRNLRIQEREEFITNQEDDIIAGIGISGRKEKTMSTIGVPQNDELAEIAKETLMEEIES